MDEEDTLFFGSWEKLSGCYMLSESERNRDNEERKEELMPISLSHRAMRAISSMLVSRTYVRVAYYRYIHATLDQNRGMDASGKVATRTFFSFKSLLNHVLVPAYSTFAY
jgi:hypothetical protein